MRRQGAEQLPQVFEQICYTEEKFSDQEAPGRGGTVLKPEVKQINVSCLPGNKEFLWVQNLTTRNENIVKIHTINQPTKRMRVVETY